MVTILIVTHNMQQAARVSDYHSLHASRRIDRVRSDHKMFTTPKDRRTQDYITGRFG